jgi:hypothetical protein
MKLLLHHSHENKQPPGALIQSSNSLLPNFYIETGDSAFKKNPNNFLKKTSYPIKNNINFD